MSQLFTRVILRLAILLSLFGLAGPEMAAAQSPSPSASPAPAQTNPARALLSPGDAAHYRQSEHLFANYTPESFAQCKPPNERIDPDKVDLDLLSAAIFHETNRRRQEHGFKPLKYLPTLRQAAAVQAEIMMKKGTIEHVNPGRPKLRSPLDRYRALGLDPQFLAENVATISGLEYRSGEEVYVQMDEGARRLSRTPDGQPIQMRTYLEFARALLTEWMNSPEHRKNILESDARFLGCSCRETKDGHGFHTFFCAQEFCTGMPKLF